MGKDPEPDTRHPPPAEGKSKPPTEPGRVARNGANTLDLPVTRLKIGWWNHKPDGAELARFRLWVPTDSGGVLTIRHEGGGTVDLRKPLRKVLKAPAAELTYEVKKGEFGEFFVIANGPVGNRVLCTFVQTSFSRYGASDSDAPLIPWNFWYWPTAKGNIYADGAADVMRRYGLAFGKDPVECVKTEKHDHGTDAVSGFPGWDFQGHCHLAAPASILFEEPQAGEHKGQKFSAEEMKFLALEYWGNFGQVAPALWDISKDRDPKAGVHFLPFYFRPGRPKTRAAFIEGLRVIFKGPKEALDDPKMNEQVGQIADAHIAKLGGAGSFADQVEKWLGELAAEFYQMLIDTMRVQKHALIANMRSHRVDIGPDEVWNHALFWYEAYYQEHSPFTKGGTGVEDEKDMVITCELRVNSDSPIPLDPPATISGNSLKPTQTSVMYRNNWRLQFDGAGKIVPKDARNQWQYTRNEDDEDLFAPTRLRPVAKPSRTRLTADDPHDLGNKFVGTELLDSGLLTIRKRYR